MDYMLSTLALWLPEECRAELARQTAGRDPRFSDVRWLPEGEPAQPLEREFLYVGGWSAAAARAESDPEVWILSADPAGQGRGRLLLARGEEALCRRLYQGLRDAFFALNRWVIDLDAAVMENASLQALTDLSGPILRNPVVFFDTGFSVLAHTGNLTERDTPSTRWCARARRIRAPFYSSRPSNARRPPRWARGWSTSPPTRSADRRSSSSTSPARTAPCWPA